MLTFFVRTLSVEAGKLSLDAAVQIRLVLRRRSWPNCWQTESRKDEVQSRKQNDSTMAVVPLTMTMMMVLLRNDIHYRDVISGERKTVF